MSIEYDAKDKDIFRMSNALKNMCTLVQERSDIKIGEIQGQIIQRKYFCPCGIVNVISTKKPEGHKIIVASDGCSI